VAQIGRSIFGDKFYTDVMTGRAFDAAFDLDLDCFSVELSCLL
jgi:hypothetical protein